MGSTKTSKILTLSALEVQKPRWRKYCETPCIVNKYTPFTYSMGLRVVVVVVAVVSMEEGTPG